MSEEIAGTCWNCGRKLSKLDYGREAHCLTCDKPTRCCRNCRHFAPGRANECLEPGVMRIVEKTRANFCECFAPATRENDPAERVSGDPERLRNAAEALFKNAV